MPGRWNTANVEAARGPMLAVTERGVKKITVMGPTQLLKTELLNNIVGYFIHQDPAPIIVMQPTGKMAEAWSKDRLDKMLRDTPVLRDLIGPRRGKDSTNTILHKEFPGGHITVVGSNSPSDLAMRPVRITLRDEVDKYPKSAGNEGDPSKLIQERSATFYNAVDVGVCSPTVQGDSAIEAEYELSDKREFHGLCPHCNKFELLKWEQVKWVEADPEGTAAYHCSQCEKPWTELERLKAIGNGKYFATAEFKGHAGFHVNKIASPWEPISVLVRKWLDANEDPEKLKTFVNTQLAETWIEKGEVPEFKRLYERRENWQLNQLQPGVVFVTCGADVQADRIECEIVGWGRDKQSWSVDYRIFMGDTSKDEVWDNFWKILNETWKSNSGSEIQLQMVTVDSGAFTQNVYNRIRKVGQPNRVRAIKGFEQLPMAFGQPKDVDVNYKGERIQRGLKYWPVGVSHLKTEIYSQLKLDGAGDNGVYSPGFCHFAQYDEEYFKRLCSEQLVKKIVNGKSVYRWIKVHERNEPLDCRVYARAAAAMFGIDRFKEEDWNILEGKDKPVVVNKDTTPDYSQSTSTQNINSSNNNYWARQNQKKFW